jgi:hypothetical protein
MIDGTTYKLLDFALVFGAAIALGVWQLLDVNKAIAERKKSSAAEDARRTGHAEGQHRADDRVSEPAER